MIKMLTKIIINIILGMIIIGILGGLIFPFNFAISEEKKDEISYTRFLNELEEGKIKEIKIYCQKKIEGKYIDGNTFTTYIPYYDKNLIEIAKKNKVIIWYGEDPPGRWDSLTMKMALGMLMLIVFSTFIIGILYDKRVGLCKNQILYWKKMPEYLNDLIKKLDTLIEVLKEKK